MRQAHFERLHRPGWSAFQHSLLALEKGRRQDAAADRFPADYRRLCHHLALAESRGYSRQLVDELRNLATRGHQQLYRHRSLLMAKVLGFITGGFPRLVRAERGVVTCAFALFFGALLLTAAWVVLFPEAVHAIVPPEQLSEMEAMYDPDETGHGRFARRGSDTDWSMFGFYIMNNIGIAFQTFASGLLLGLGSLFFLLFNGITIGAIAGHLTAIGYHQPFWSFVIGHGAFELTAIALAGAAGLKLGVSLIAPGHRTRLRSLQHAATRAIRLVAGAALFLLVAAFIEAFWSSTQTFDAAFKYAIGALLWLLVGLYLGFAGRSRATE